VGVCRGVWGTFDIPQTALVATLDTYDFFKHSLQPASCQAKVNPIPSALEPKRLGA
jgi:hypothetical protein